MLKNALRWVLWALLICYLGILADLVFLSAAFGRVDASINRYSTMNLIPFRTVMIYIRGIRVVGPMAVVINILGNIGVFVPIGFLLPILWKRCRRLLQLTLIALCGSVFIEVTQGFFAVGVVDVDDVILNVTGALLGYGLYYMNRKRLNNIS